ncbi:hypothetical protein C8F04DRAFT_1296863 [Mycena alexandri]|uniref:Uncharacterized protein n=1 Tax=Mycena alexandri TaxID=1745969 RepID=A0AAD6SF01_9AGAR|nr:hypothetical protein C8F04DRAFT_1296863 [Mycena alexandri]
MYEEYSVADRENLDSAEFRTFRRNLFHGSLRHILQTLRPGMTTPEVVKFADGHYRKTIYGLGPYISDYPDQVFLACIVQGWCARSNKNLDGAGGRRSHELTDAFFEALDRKALWDEYGIIPDPFTSGFPRAAIHSLLSPDLLHQIIQGTFKAHLVTWVGEYLEIVDGKGGQLVSWLISTAAMHGIAAVPPFRGLHRFPQGRGFKQWTGDDSKALMKVYLPAIEGYVPAQMVGTFSAFLKFCYLVRRNRIIFEQEGVVLSGFSLPRQHSMQFDAVAPNGLCSSMHIKPVKEPWRRSSRHEALGQMLTVNDRIDKLGASRVDFVERGMIPGPTRRPPPPDQEHGDDGGPSDRRDISGKVLLARRHTPNCLRRPAELGKLLDASDLPNMRIRAVRSWRGGSPRRDCVFVEHDTTHAGFRGLHAARVIAFLSSEAAGFTYPCALVLGSHLSVMHPARTLESHLITVHGNHSVPRHIKHTRSLDLFAAFYINEYADHHSHEIAF